MSFDDAFNNVMNRCVWPASLDDFLPKRFVAPSSSRYAQSVRNAGLMASFGNSSTPDFLLTALDTAFDFTNLKSIKITNNNIEIIADKITKKADLDRYGVVAIIGTSGSGKTRLTLHLAWSDYAILYNFSTEGNGGSDDLKEILRRSAGNYESLRNMLRANVMFRKKLLQWCQTKYGDGFKPAHWMMLQLYSHKIVNLDMFDAFSELSVNVMDEKGVADADIFKWIVLDEAQAAEALGGSFEIRRNQRSALYAIIDILRSIFRYSPLVVCGTGMSISALTTSIPSPIKRKTGLAMLGLCTYFTPNDVIKALKKWGVNDAESHRDSCVYSQGRPRFADYLARNVLINGGWRKETDAFDELKSYLGETWDKLDGLSLEFPHSKPREASRDLGAYMRDMAFEWLLGKTEPLINGSALAIELGVGTLDAKAGGAVLREPIVIDSIYPDPLAKFETLLTGEHPTIGYEFEDYVVLSAQSIANYVSKHAQNTKFGAPPFTSKQLPGCARVKIVVNGEEPEHLRNIFERKEAIQIIRTATYIGADVIYVFWDANGNPVVVFCQVKSGMASFPEAFRSLEKPYYQNRGEVNESCGNAAALQRLQKCLKDYKASIVYLVVKPGADPLQKYPVIVRDEVMKCNVLKVVIGKKPGTRPVGMHVGFEQLKRFKDFKDLQ